MNEFEDDVDGFSSVTPSPYIEMFDEEEDGEPSPFKKFDYKSQGHNFNIANALSDNTLKKISAELFDAIESDAQSIEEWMTALSQSFKLLGLKEEVMATPFPGACGVYSTVAIQGMVEFNASAEAELLPPGGPVREEQIGETNDETDDKAKRIEDFSNMFFTQMFDGFYPNKKSMLPWIYWAGMAFTKTYYDPVLERPTCDFIKPSDFIVNYETTSLSDCFRMTECQTINAMELAARQSSGLYRNIKISSLERESDPAPSILVDDEIDRISGQTKPEDSKVTDYKLYECHVYLNIKDYDFEDLVFKDRETVGNDRDMQEQEGSTEINSEEYEDADDKDNDLDNEFLPYVITLDRGTKKILAIYRDWRENDEKKARKTVYTDYGFVQGLGFYKLGASQLIGGTTKAASNLLRNMVNGLFLSNMPGGLYAKGTRLDNNNLNISPNEFVPIDTGGLPINDIFTTMPYKEPSPAINVLRQDLEASAAKLMGAASSQLPDFNPNSPVGTMHMIMEVINKVQSSIMRGIRASMSAEFKIFYELFKEWLPDEPFYFNKMGGKDFVCSADFIDTINIVPIADAFVTSQIQRQMQSLVILEKAIQNPQLHNMYEVYKKFYKNIKVDYIDKILPEPKETQALNPLTENANMLQLKPVVAAMRQDDDAHITVHSPLLQDPNPMVVQIAQAHIQEHTANKYTKMMLQNMGMDPSVLSQELSPEQENQIAMMAAEATQQMQANQQQSAPPPPLDPAIVMLEEVKVRQQAVEEKAKVDAAKIDIEFEKVKLDYERLALEQEKIVEKAKYDEERISADAFKAHLAYELKRKEMAAKVPMISDATPETV